MTTDKQVLIPIYQMSAKQIEVYIKCFDVNVQTWAIIVQSDQVQDVLNLQSQRHDSCLHRINGICDCAEFQIELFCKWIFASRKLER